MSLGDVAEIFLGKTEKTEPIQKTEIQPVVLQPRSLQNPLKTPDEVRQIRNELARIAAAKKAA